MSLSELHTVNQLSKQWRSVIQSMRCMSYTLIRPGGWSFEVVPLHSILAAHVSCINLIGNKFRSYYDYHRLKGQSRHWQHQLLSMTHRFPHLKRGLGQIIRQYTLLTKGRQGDVPIVLPNELEEFEAVMNVELMPRMISALSSLHSLTSLQIHITNKENFSALYCMDYSPLQQLIKLETLTLPYPEIEAESLLLKYGSAVNVPVDEFISPSLIHLIRSLPQLTTLKLVYSSCKGYNFAIKDLVPHLITAIAAKPHQLKLTSFK